jgi:hypothetical protein
METQEPLDTIGSEGSVADRALIAANRDQSLRRI